MSIEKERKFLIASDDWMSLCDTGIQIKQGYLNIDPNRTVRVRIFGAKAFLTVKGRPLTDSRLEYEYEIPMDDAKEMLQKLCRHPLIEKHRFQCDVDGYVWEIDVFLGENEGLLIAELEIGENRSWPKSLPSWIGEEVTGDEKYYNSNLLKNSYRNWRK